MLSSLFPLLYGLVLMVLLWQALRVMRKGFFTQETEHQSNKLIRRNAKDDRTGRVTIHPELLDQDGRITDEELLTVRFSENNDPPQTNETSAE